MRQIAIILLALLLAMSAFAEETDMHSDDFSGFTNVTLTGIDIDALNVDERSVLRQAA